MIILKYFPSHADKCVLHLFISLERVRRKKSTFIGKPVINIRGNDSSPPSPRRDENKRKKKTKLNIIRETVENKYNRYIT